MSEGNILRIEQGGRHARVWLNGFELTKALRSLTLDMEAHPTHTTVRLEVAVDQVELTALGESDRTLLVSIHPDVEEALQAIGWVKTTERTTYHLPREEVDL